jgi:ribulose-phosphate 3-epimerase
MIKVAPSILSADFAALGQAVRAVEEAGADYIHFDVMDGRFVPPITFGQDMLKALKGCTSLPIDAHLMVERPDESALSFVQSGASIVTFHPETCRHPHRLLGAIRAAGARAGVALNPGTSVSSVEYLLELCDMVVLMGVNPGYGGQAFIPNTLNKARELCDYRAKLGLSFEIELDGGVKASNAGQIIGAGVETLVAGSAVFGAPDLARAIRSIREAQVG